MTKEELLEELAEKKLSEEALRKSEAKFRSIFNHSVQFMGILDTNGILLEINKIALQIWGVKKSDVINKPFWEAPWFSNPPELQTKVHKAIEDAAQGNFIRFEIKHIMSDGSYRYIDASLKPVNDADSKVVKLIAEGHDITERMKVEDELQKAHDELELRVRERTLELQEKNIALKVLLKQREDDKKELEHNILSNIKSLIQPHIIKLKRNNASSEDIAYLNIVESNLENIISPFSEKLSSNYMRFTSKEIQIANLIKEGKKDKEIMEMMNIAFDTVKAHRKNIRKKLGIHGKGTSLRNKLLSI